MQLTRTMPVGYDVLAAFAVFAVAVERQVFPWPWVDGLPAAQSQGVERES